MTDNNQFQYQKSEHLARVTMLQARISDFSYIRHAHEEYSFGVTLAGRQDFFADGAFHRSLPGSVMVFNPGQVHDGHSGVDDPLRYRMLYIHPDELEPMLNAAGVKDARDFQMADVLVRDDSLRQQIITLTSLIDQPEPDPLQQEHVLYQMAARIAQYHGCYSPDCPQRQVDQLLRRARDFIHDNLQQELSLDQISAQVNLSKYHFIRMFRQQFGITPHQYIMNCRVNRVREGLLLGEGLDDLVFNYGFSDLSHLNRRFKPVFGMTPCQYRQLILAR